MARIACVAVEKALCRFDRLYSYQIPTDMPLQAGCRVLVPFGRGRDRMGLVVEIAEGDKCDRCWMHSTEGIHTEDGFICARCAAVIQNK